MIKNEKEGWGKKTNKLESRSWGLFRYVEKRFEAGVGEHVISIQADPEWAATNSWTIVSILVGSKCHSMVRRVLNIYIYIYMPLKQLNLSWGSFTGGFYLPSKHLYNTSSLPIQVAQRFLLSWVEGWRVFLCFLLQSRLSSLWEWLVERKVSFFGFCLGSCSTSLILSSPGDNVAH